MKIYGFKALILVLILTFLPGCASLQEDVSSVPFLSQASSAAAMPESAYSSEAAANSKAMAADTAAAFHFAAQIREDMPVYNFAVDMKQQPETDTEFSEFDVTITVTDDAENYLQTLSFTVQCSDNTAMLPTVEKFLTDLSELADINFDGYQDLYFSLGGYRNLEWKGIVWSPEDGRFYEEPITNFHSSSYPVFDREKQAVYTTNVSGAADHTWTAFVWQTHTLEKHRQIHVFAAQNQDLPDGYEMFVTETAYNGDTEALLLSLSLTQEGNKSTFSEYFAGNSIWDGHFEWEYYLDGMPD